MTPEEQALLEQFYDQTEGDYTARHQQFLDMQKETPSLRGITLQDFARFTGMKIATAEQQKA